MAPSVAHDYGHRSSGAGVYRRARFYTRYRCPAHTPPGPDRAGMALAWPGRPATSPGAHSRQPGPPPSPSPPDAALVCARSPPQGCCHTRSKSAQSGRLPAVRSPVSSSHHSHPSANHWKAPASNGFWGWPAARRSIVGLKAEGRSIALEQTASAGLGLSAWRFIARRDGGLTQTIENGRTRKA